MAVEVKDISGNSVPVTGRGQGIFNTVGASAGLLALLQNGGLGGILGNNTVNPMTGEVGNGTACLVSKDQFYNTIIENLKEQSARDLAVSARMANIEAAVSQNAAVSECNKNSIRREIEVTQDKFDMTISNERVVNELILKNALCNTLKGTPMISPTQIGDNYLAPHRILSSYEPREYAPARHCGHGWGYDGGCEPCGGYRGF